MWRFQPYVAKVPKLMAVRWTPEVETDGIVVVNNGHDQTYAYINNTYFAYGKGQDSVGQIGDYLVYEPPTGFYYFIRASEFDKEFVPDPGS